MQRIGILGGTFNPIHIGHLVIAQMAYEKLKLDKVIFIPSNIPPHKDPRNVAEAEYRFSMVKKAIYGNPFFEVSDIELNREGKSYSIDTIKILRKQYPKNTKFYFLIGGDNIVSLDTWKSIDELLNFVIFIGISRPNVKIVNPKIQVHYLDAPELHISSSVLRQRIAQKKTIKYLIPEQVIKYIEKNKLYRN